MPTAAKLFRKVLLKQQDSTGKSINISSKLSILYTAIYFLMTQQTLSLFSKLPALAELRELLSGPTFYFSHPSTQLLLRNPTF